MTHKQGTEKAPKLFSLMVVLTSVSGGAMFLFSFLDYFFDSSFIAIVFLLSTVTVFATVLYWIGLQIHFAKRNNIHSWHLIWLYTLFAFVCAGIFGFPLLTVDHPLLWIGLYGSVFLSFSGTAYVIMAMNHENIQKEHSSLFSKILSYGIVLGLGVLPFLAFALSSFAFMIFTISEYFG